MTRSIQRALIAGLIVIGLLLAGLFGLRAFHAFKKFRGNPPLSLAIQATDQAETDVNLIREWMTIPYIAKMYEVPPEILFDALEIQSLGNEEKSLKEINRKYFPDSKGIVEEKIKAAILEYQTSGKPDAPPEVDSDPPNPPIKPIGPIPP
jgi:hypothetical protein